MTDQTEDFIKQSVDLMDRHRAAEKGSVAPWRPISEAPKDGTNILGSSGGKIPFVMAWDDGEEIWVTFNCCYEHTVTKYGGKAWTPTHWMPLPAPPGKEAP